MAASQFRRAFLATVRAMMADRAALTLLLGSVILYSFFYPSAYSHQVVDQVPVVVVDLDHSSTSRALLRKAASVRQARITDQVGSLAEAEVRLAQGKAFAVLLIPADFERDILRGGQGRIALYSNGGYLLRSSTALTGLASAITSFAGDAAATQARAQGAPAKPAVTLIQRPLFNTREGYGSAVVPGVAELIIQQTMLMGLVMLAGTRREQLGRLRLSGRALLGVAAAFAAVGLFNLIYYAGFVFWFQDYPRGGNLVGLLVAGPLYIAAVVAGALLLGSFYRTRERPLQLLVATSVPMFFLAGLSWPPQATPEPLLWLARLIPTTPGINVMIKLNQMGASLREVAPELINLAALTVVYGALAWWRYRPGRRET